MNFNKNFQKQAQMTESELVFKKLYMEKPEFGFDTPHSPQYFENAIKEALQNTSSCQLLTEQLLNNCLNEQIFFQDDLDTVLYRHLRYLPSIHHSHTFFEVVCVIAGNCTNYILDQKLDMQEGDVCIIAPATLHSIRAFSDDCIIINILLRTSTFENAFFGILSDNNILSDFFMHILYRSKTHPYLFVRTENDHELLDYVLHAYQEFLGNHQYKAKFLNNIISAFFIILLRNHESRLIVPESGTQERNENVLFILKYIQENYCTVTLKELSDFFHYSDRQIQRILRTCTGLSFSENIQKLKMQHAARLLCSTDLSIAAIAEDLGYTDLSNFRYIFKKYFQMNPMEYRKLQ